MNRIILDFLVWIWCIIFAIYILIITASNVFAFNKLKNGFETITSTYLIPLSAAVGGASFILYVILSYFKQEEYQKKVGNVLALTIFSATGVEIINSLVQSFSQGER